MKPRKPVAKRARGRPRRTDNPTAIRINLPGTLRQWLRVQAAVEARDQQDLIVDGLALYRASLKQRTPKVGRTQ